jgi:hypothetical protein
MSAASKRDPQYLVIDQSFFKPFPFEHAWADEAWKAQRIDDDVIRGNYSLIFFSQLTRDMCYKTPDSLRDGFTIGIERTRHIDKPLKHWAAFLTHDDVRGDLFASTVEMSCECADAAAILPGAAGKGWHKIAVGMRYGQPSRSGRVWFSPNAQHSASFVLAAHAGVSELPRLEYMFERSTKPSWSMAIVFPLDTRVALQGDGKRSLAHALPRERTSLQRLPAGTVVVGGETQRTLTTECFLAIYTMKQRDFSAIDFTLTDCGGTQRSRITTWHSETDKFLRADHQQQQQKLTLRQAWVSDASIRWPFNYERMAQIAMVMLHMCFKPSMWWTVPLDDRAMLAADEEETPESVSVSLPVYPLMWLLDWLPEFTHRPELLKLHCLQRVETSLRGVDAARTAGPSTRTRGAAKKNKK